MNKKAASEHDQQALPVIMFSEQSEREGEASSGSAGEGGDASPYNSSGP
ncbi:MAG: hypothetical protein HY202_08190 [Nitrospirae bacterium]|nr:hypothetical protein [Nitrospirota bacterium]